MQIPDTPMKQGGSPATYLSNSATFEARPHIMIEGSNIAVNPHKRQKTSPVSWTFGSSTKRRDVKHSPDRSVSPRSGRSQSNGSPPVSTRRPSRAMEVAPCEPSHNVSRPVPSTRRSSTQNVPEVEALPTLPLQQTRIRDMVPIVIYEALRVGGRPDSSVGEPTRLGERIEVRTRSSSGYASYQIIEWSVQPDVPEMLSIDERDLSKLISCVFLNAVKFTENGKISILVSMSKSFRSVRINIIDTGAGIPKDFVPELFKAFSREDDSLTRSREGLGLGLLVAKGLARKLGGDLYLVHTETSGDTHGSEFEIKVPIGGVESGARPGTPFERTPTPSSSSPQVQRSSSSYFATSYPKPALNSPLQPLSQMNTNIPVPPTSTDPDTVNSSAMRGMSSSSSKVPISIRSSFDRKLAEKHPLNFLVAEDNKINRRLLVSMLRKLGYKEVYEAFDGREAVRIMKEIAISGLDPLADEHCRPLRRRLKPVDVILMDLWMPEMDGYEATEKILDIYTSGSGVEGQPLCIAPPTVLAVSADVTEKAISRATAVGMEGFMTKPYKLVDLQRLIEEVCRRSEP
jgi:CheY-like chemotaxis protein